MPFIFSTLTNNHLYTNWEAPTEKSMIRNIVGKPVLIRGGANLANVENPRVAPKGIMTQVTDDQLSYLERNSVFRKHIKAGLILVMQTSADPEKVAKSDMTPKDNSAPITPDDERFKKMEIEAIEEKPSLTSRIKGAVGLQ